VSHLRPRRRDGARDSGRELLGGAVASCVGAGLGRSHLDRRRGAVFAADEAAINVRSKIVENTRIF